MKRGKKSEFYVDNKKLYEIMCTYHKAYKLARRKKQQAPMVPPYAIEAFVRIAAGMASKKNFAMYSYIDEMQADAIENCVVQAQSFDPEIGSNPHAYFSAVVWNAFVRRIKKERKQQYIKYKNYDNIMIADELAGIPRSKTSEVNDISHEYVRSFEEGIQKKQGIVKKKKTPANSKVVKIENRKLLNMVKKRKPKK